jgi:putative methionine-R-sulfoxide reductase with GAF domain
LRFYRPTREILADIERRLRDNTPCFHHSPLEDVAELLAAGRSYTWVGIYLTIEKHAGSALAESALDPRQVAVPGTRTKVLVAMKVGGRELGFLNVESPKEDAFGPEDRVLLERVAGLLARFLAGPGKYLVRRAARQAPKPRAAAA